MEKLSNTYKNFTIILLTIFVTSCATNFDKGNKNKQVREDLVGYWYGKVSLDDGTIHHWIANHQADGQLYLEFKRVKDSIIVSRTSEEGIWYSEGERLISEIKVWYSENGIRNESDDQYTYQIINVEPNRIVYSDENHEYNAIRVDAEYSF